MKLPIVEVAELVGISTGVITRWRRRGLIKGTPALKNDRLVMLVSVAQVRRLISQMNVRRGRPFPAGSAELLTSVQAGAVMGISRARVRQLIMKGQLPAVKGGGVWRVELKDAKNFKRVPVGRPRH